MSRALTDLVIPAQPYAEAFVAALRAEGLRFSILETRRPKLVQVAYFSRGRDDYETICAKYRAAKLAIPNEAEAASIITRTMASKHLSGRAMDVVPLTERGTIPWSVRSQEIADLWLRLGEIGERCGLVWGGRWPDPAPKMLDEWGLGWDKPHYEWEG